MKLPSLFRTPVIGPRVEGEDFVTADQEKSVGVERSADLLTEISLIAGKSENVDKRSERVGRPISVRSARTNFND